MIVALNFGKIADARRRRFANPEGTAIWPRRQVRVIPWAVGCVEVRGLSASTERAGFTHRSRGPPGLATALQRERRG
jgi:hypothetical protein